MKIHNTYTKFLNEAKSLPDGIAEYDGAWKSYENDLIVKLETNEIIILDVGSETKVNLMRNYIVTVEDK